MHFRLPHSLRGLLCLRTAQVVDAVEAMLRRQLVEAIGKELTPTDFAAYMVHHRRTLFKPDFTPQAFSYPIRRPDHYPEGILSLETDGDHQPIATTVRYRQVGHAMRLPLGAGMEVQLQGEHFVHAQVLHQFSCNPGQGPAAPPRPQPVLRCPAMHSLSTEQSVDVKLKRCKMCSQLLRSTAQWFVRRLRVPTEPGLLVDAVTELLSSNFGTPCGLLSAYHRLVATRARFASGLFARTA